MPNRSSTEASKATLEGYTLQTKRDPYADEGGMRAWRLSVTDPSGCAINDPIGPGTWLSQTEAEERAEKIVRAHSKVSGKEIPATAMISWETE